MKIAIALTVMMIGFSAILAPASAGFVNPRSSSLHQAFQHGD